MRVATSEVGANRFERVTLDGIGTLMVTGPNASLSAAAGGDLNLHGAAVVNAGEGGETTLTAGNDVTIGSVTTRRRDAVVWDARNHLTVGESSEVGSLLSGRGDVAIAAGRDLNIRASDIDTDGALVGVAGRDIAIDAGRDTHLHDENHHFRDSGTFSKKTTIRRYYRESETVRGSTVSVGSAHLEAYRLGGLYRWRPRLTRWSRYHHRRGRKQPLAKQIVGLPGSWLLCAYHSSALLCPYLSSEIGMHLLESRLVFRLKGLSVIGEKDIFGLFFLIGCLSRFM